MNTTCVFLVLLAAFAAPAPQREAKPASDLERHVYPLAKMRPAPKVVLDASRVPGQRAWGEVAKRIVVDWYPYVTSLLATDAFDAPREIRIVIVPELPVPASTSGDVISIQGPWIAQHPDDFGMVVHELVHVVQRYPNGGGEYGWLVEGIADYVRWWRYEPEHPREVAQPDQSYKDGYRVTAAFLAWAMRKHDMRLVVELDRALRKGEDAGRVFEKITGRSLDDAWKDYAGAKK